MCLVQKKYNSYRNKTLQLYNDFLPVFGGMVIGGLVGIVIGGLVVSFGGLVGLGVVGFGVTFSSHTPHVFEHLSSTSWQPSSLRSSTHSRRYSNNILNSVLYNKEGINIS